MVVKVNPTALLEEWANEERNKITTSVGMISSIWFREIATFVVVKTHSVRPMRRIQWRQTDTQERTEKKRQERWIRGKNERMTAPQGKID